MEQNNQSNEYSEEVTLAEEISEAEVSKTTNEAPSDTPAEFIPESLSLAHGPHIHADDTSRSIMLDVCIALLPALIWGVYMFGWRVLTITLVSVFFAVGSEFLYEILLKKPITVLDFSAVVTGLLLAMTLSPSVPLWMPAIGSVFAIIVVKQLFGGIGKNIVNPALAARVFLSAWENHMSKFPAPESNLSPLVFSVDGVDAVSGATQLALLKDGTIASDFSIFNSLIGYESGSIGEVSALLLGAGFIYLLYRRVITWHIPVTFIGTVFLVTLVFSRNALLFDYAIYEILAGGLILGAIFMATDYSTTPITQTGRVIFGIGCGLLTVLIRYFGNHTEGVAYAILVMNLFTWYLDYYLKPVKFGGKDNARNK